MGHFGTLFRFLAVFMSAGIVLLRLVVLTTLVMMRRFAVMVGCGFMLSRGKVMMWARFVLGFHWHWEFLLKKTKFVTMRGKMSRWYPPQTSHSLRPVIWHVHGAITSQ